jgi:hypothetical protein
MATKKAKPMVSKRVADRKAFVEKTAGMASTPRSKQAARQKFFVQTRIKELEAKGQTVSAAKRKELRQKFQSGNVSRAGFGAPKKKAAGSGTSTSTVTSKVTPKVTARTDARGSTGFGKQGMGTQKGYSYTRQSGETVNYSSGNPNRAAYSRSQIVRNSDRNTKKKTSPSTTNYRRTA